MTLTTQAVTDRLFVLSLSAGQIFSMATDGTDRRLIVTGGHMPDGVAVDPAGGHIYWTNMGVPNRDDGSIERADFDGRNRVALIPQGVTHTPKQICLDPVGRKLYWADREGMRMMRADLDGSGVETLVVTGDPQADQGDATRWCVGVALDQARRQLYWTQKGSDNAGVGRIVRAGLEIPAGETAATRTDIEVWRDSLPEPIDLEFDAASRTLYWTDRGDPPDGNSVSRAAVDAHQPPEVLIRHLMEAIGLALDLEGDRVFVTDLGGSVYAVPLSGARPEVLAYAQGNLSGIAYAKLPAKRA